MFELANLLGSSLLGGILQIMGSKAKAQQEQFKMMMDKSKFVAEQQEKSRSNTNSFFMMTRRIIALVCVFSIVLLPMLAPVFIDVPIYVQTEIVTGSDWLIFSTESSDTVWKEVDGIPLLGWHKDVIISIIGLYMGSSISKA
tara:strand:+ start:2899 stop:3324 length:426 start_codon:yes stop_codon:yes gene_type:complete